MSRLRGIAFGAVAVLFYIAFAGLAGLILNEIDPAFIHSHFATGLLGIALVWPAGKATIWLMDRIWPERRSPRD